MHTSVQALDHRSIPRLRALVTLAVAVLGAPLPLVAQGATGAVRGQVVDSTAGEALGGADIVLWETTHRVQTNEDGYFLIEGVPVGEYAIVFFHPRLAHLGVSAGQASITVRDGLTTDVELATPSMETVTRNQCLFETAEGSFVFGAVLDRETRVAIPKSTVHLSWTERLGGRTRARQTETDGEGWFRFCGLPTGVTASGMAEFLSMSSTAQQVAVAADGARIDFLLGEYQPSGISGQLADQDSGGPLSGVAVRLMGTRYFTVTDGRGEFQFSDVPPGEYVLEAQMLGYQSRSETVNLLDGIGISVEMKMSTEPIELEPIVVTVDQQRMRARLAMGGQVVSREDIAEVERRTRNIADLLRNTRVSGLRIRREEGQFCVEFESGQVRLLKTRPCESVLMFVDDNRVAPEGIYDLPPDAIDHFVVFRPVQAGALFGTGGAHGAVMFYTKNGQRRRR